MEENAAGRAPPRRRTPPPGARSRALADRLRRVESPNITGLDEDPVFWAEAHGATVRDVDDNSYIDLTAGFGVAMAGHANVRVIEAIARQAARLAHALGDVHPADIKCRLLERLAELAPGPLSVSILGSAGFEAVEAALKTAQLRTQRPGIVAFEGAYHGLGYGALAVTWNAMFRAPFAPQLFHGVRFAPFPATDPTDAPARMAAALDAVRTHIEEAEATAAPIGAVILEPVQGRAGLIVPPPGFLAALREMCDARRIVLIFDEIYTGFGRTGEWFACQHEGIIPDLLVVGKALTGSLPLSAAIGTPEVMAAWPPSKGEAIHTSTFIGNPIACAAALAQIDEIESNALVERAAHLGARIRARITEWPALHAAVDSVRGIGLLQGVVITGRNRARSIANHALRQGVLLLTEGPAGDVVAITPPATITDDELAHALDVVEAAIAAVSRDEA